MKKKIVAFVCALSVAVGAMAVEIDTARFRADWSKLVDRVACEYVRAYIISLENNAEMGQRAHTFKADVAPKLRNNGKYVTLDDLSAILVQNDWKHTGEVLLTPMADRKLLVPVDQTLEHLVDLSCYTPAMQSCLRSASTQLYSIIASEYPYTPQPKVEEHQIEEKVTVDTAAITPIIVENESKPFKTNIVWVIILGALVAVEGFLLFYRTSPKRIITLIKESRLMYKTYVRKDDNDISELRASIIQLTRRIQELEAQQAKKSTSDTPTGIPISRASEIRSTLAQTENASAVDIGISSNHPSTENQ